MVDPSVQDPWALPADGASQGSGRRPVPGTHANTACPLCSACRLATVLPKTPFLLKYPGQLAADGGWSENGFHQRLCGRSSPRLRKINIIWMTQAEEYHDQVRNSSFCAITVIKYIFLYDPFEFLDDGNMGLVGCELAFMYPPPPPF